MIIASPAKKEISIPLQPMTSAVSSDTNNNLFEIEEAAAVDLVTVNSRSKGKENRKDIRVFTQQILIFSFFFYTKNRHK
jgi:hypothetical protein